MANFPILKDKHRRVLVVGQFAAPQYDSAVTDAFENLDCVVERFKTISYISGNIWKTMQYRFLFGPNFWKMWNDLLNIAKGFMPDIIYFRRPVEFPPFLLRRLKASTNAILIEYMNDDPFGPDKNKPKWRYFKSSIPIFDLHLAFRKSNFEDFYRLGAKKVELMLPYYVESMHKIYDLTDEDIRRYSCDALFVGHEENDFRLDCFDALFEAKIDLRLYGAFYGYGKGRLFYKLLPTCYIAGEEYAKAIRAATCSLCFFSSRNRDTITTRVFEIPMCGGVLVAQRNPDIEKLFEEGGEAMFFSSVQELVDIVLLLKANPHMRERIAVAGRKRVLAGGHEVKDRIRKVIQLIDELLANTNS